MDLPQKDQRIALVTGASSGIGEAVAEYFCKHGIAVIACGRRMDKLLALKERMQGRAPVHVVSFDVTNYDKVKRKISSLPAEWRRINILVNNAGNAHGLDPIQNGNEKDWDAMIDINVKGLLYVTKATLPLMPTMSDSMIVNIGSIAGKESYPNGNVYCASKAAVDSLTQGMRFDLYKQGIRVGAVHPGLVSTEFSLVRFKGDKTRADNVYNGVRALTAADCADAVLYMVTRPSHVSLHDVLLMPADQAAARDLIRAPAKL